MTIGLALSGCATPPSDPAARAEFERTNDPLEPLNRKTFVVNQFIDRLLFRPAAKTYVAVFPEDARKAIHHVLDNMREPTLFFNNLLQGEFERAGITLGRFVVNSTIGVGGLVDVMSLSGVERQPADFGQTMFVWGIPSGPYLILPILGPTNPRDAIGSAVDSYADPTTILANEHGVTELTTARLVAGGADDRAQVLDVLDSLEKNSVDFYAEMRSLAQQHRAAQLHHDKAPDAEPGLYNDPGQSAPGKPTPASLKPAARTGGPRQTAMTVPVTGSVSRPLSTSLPPARPPATTPAAVPTAMVASEVRPTPRPSPVTLEPTSSGIGAVGAKQTAMAPPSTSGFDFDESPSR